ncbi:MAG: energy-coupling factor transporter transmembrane protein EcfT [Parasporobacterium sp.]|nr:energy-coupling factor transporter transmembrane protein EcfT [Parasporobacterium sp.]
MDENKRGVSAAEGQEPEEQVSSMMPEWMKTKEEYHPPKGSNRFGIKTMQTIGGILSRVRIQAGHEKKHTIPALVKFFILIALILLVSISQNRIILLAVLAAFLVCLCFFPGRDLLSVLKSALLAALLAAVLLTPAFIINPLGRLNNVIVVGKVFLCVGMVNIFNHTTQWNHITGALRKLHIPGIFVFTLDITLKYIVLLGTLIRDLLTSMTLRSVGKNQKKYQSVGGVLGQTFIRSTEMSQEMYEAMQCRGFTDDYKGL